MLEGCGEGGAAIAIGHEDTKVHKERYNKSTVEQHSKNAAMHQSLKSIY